MRDRTVDEQLAEWGIPVDATGPFACELRAKMNERENHGLRTGGVSFGPLYYEMDAEQRAKEWLSIIWTIESGYFYRVSGIDPVISWRYDMKGGWPGRRHFEIRWSAIPARIGDRLREAAYLWRVFRDRYILGIRDPYA